VSLLSASGNDASRNLVDVVAGTQDRTGRQPRSHPGKPIVYRYHRGCTWTCFPVLLVVMIVLNLLLGRSCSTALWTPRSGPGPVDGDARNVLRARSARCRPSRFNQRKNSGGQAIVLGQVYQEHGGGFRLKMFYLKGPFTLAVITALSLAK